MTTATRGGRKAAFGAELLGDKRASFALWAPGQDEVRLVLTGRGDREEPMRREADGWFRLEAEAAAGEPYLFALGSSGQRVPDPASRRQESTVHGPSVVTDPNAYRWRHEGWKG